MYTHNIDLLLMFDICIHVQYTYVCMCIHIYIYIYIAYLSSGNNSRGKNSRQGLDFGILLAKGTTMPCPHTALRVLMIKLGSLKPPCVTFFFYMKNGGKSPTFLKDQRVGGTSPPSE